MTVQPWSSLDVTVTQSAFSADPPFSGWEEFWNVTALFPTRTLVVCTGTEGWSDGPPESAEQLSLMGRALLIHRTGDELWIGDNLHLKTRGNFNELTVRGHDVTAEAVALAMTELHRSGGWLPLHASVVARSGQAVAITGPSGAGKSTALLRLMSEGFQVVAEDRAFWHPSSGRVVGMDRTLRAYTGSLDLFAPQWLPRLPLPQDQKGKWLLPLTELGEQPAQPAQLRRLLLLGAPQPAETGTLVRAIWEATGRPLLREGTVSTQEGVRRLLRQVGVDPVDRESVVSAARQHLGIPGTCGERLSVPPAT